MNATRLDSLHRHAAPAGAEGVRARIAPPGARPEATCQRGTSAFEA